MRRILSAADAKNRFADALRQAENGDVVLITRYRKPVAALVGGERLERIERLEGRGEAMGAGADAGTADGADAAKPSPAPPAAEATPAALREWAAAGALRRIDYDLARAPEKFRPVLRLIRANLFRPRITVGRLQATLKVAGHDFTSEFRRVLGVSIHRYFTDRRLEVAADLLVETDLPVDVIGPLLGYRDAEALSRAFKKRHGVRPPLYREFGGGLSPEVARDAGPDRPPLAPRFLAGRAALPPGARCGCCGGALAAGEALRVFEELAPLCDGCARRRAPELAGMLGSGEAG